MKTCDICGSKVDDFEICTHEQAPTSNGFGSRITAPFVTKNTGIDFDGKSGNSRNVNALIAGPLLAIALDIFIPKWSTLILTGSFVAISTVVVNTVWANFRSGASFSLGTLVKSLPRQLLTPSLISLHSNAANSKNRILAWTMALAVSILAVQFIGTPGNAKGLESSLQDAIRAKTGQGISVTCPSFFTTAPGSSTTCHAKVLFGVQIPVHVTVTDVLGHISWNASLN